jgi:hypothetical protein
VSPILKEKGINRSNFKESLLEARSLSGSGTIASNLDAIRRNYGKEYDGARYPNLETLSIRSIHRLDFETNCSNLAIDSQGLKTRES